MNSVYTSNVFPEGTPQAHINGVQGIMARRAKDRVPSKPAKPIVQVRAPRPADYSQTVESRLRAQGKDESFIAGVLAKL